MKMLVFHHSTTPKLHYSLILLLAIAARPAVAESRFVRNGGLSQRGSLLKDGDIQQLRGNGWTCPDAKDWPIWWNGLGANMKVECLTTGGRDNDSFFRISGKDGLVTGYYGYPFDVPSYVFTFWLRGKGTLSAGVIAYELSKDHTQVVGQVFNPALAPVQIRVDSDQWVRYRRLLPKGDKELTVHVAFSAPEGMVDFDGVDIEPSNRALDLVVEEEARLYGKGALIENMDLVRGDDAFQARAGEYASAIEVFRKKAAALDKQLVTALEKEVAALQPYLLSKTISTVRAVNYNEMLAQTRVMQRLTGETVGDAPAITARQSTVTIDHKPGLRKARTDTVTITELRSNKVRYDENENATTRATLVNTSGREYSGTLIALMHLDLDTTREITRTAFRVGGAETRAWSFAYRVGPETYGRAIEVRFLGEKGEVVDSWQEYFAVAAEWFRVHQHTYAGQNKFYDVNPWVTYFNQSHYFAHEPTDFGIHDTDAEIYLSGQAGYQVNQVARKAQMDFYRSMGITHTFYQTFAFCGQMGYEEMRKHPEYVLYDENGQPAVDPIYGGYPNPIELATTLEVGPKRKVTKPYLDRKYTPWQHCAANFAMEEAVVYQTECIKKYARDHGFDGIYIDGNMGVLKGYGYDGTPNVTSGKPEDFARLGARNHRLFSEMLKKENPNFGTWYNWGYRSVEWAIGVGLTSSMGSGTGGRGDVGDENIRAATGYKNVMLLNETGSFLQSKEGWTAKPAEFVQALIEQRDFAVQKWGASTLIGYSFFPWKEEEPGPGKWAWPTVNYLGAQLIATQNHYAGGFLPSYRPTFQFMTRYSRFLWAPDIKVVPNEEKLVQVSSPETIWWKRMVYQRRTAEGYDLIVHLVRIPPTERWDYNWVDEPEPLRGVRVTANLGTGKLQQAQAMRPYHFEEEQQPVQTVLKGSAQTGKVSVEIPPFRYHTMLVIRVKDR